MRLIILIAILLSPLLMLPCLASAGGSLSLGLPTISSNGHSLSSEHTFKICITSDPQNITSGQQPPSYVYNDCVPIQAHCGDYCVKSPYCKDTWETTLGIITRNMTYSMIGRHDLINYVGITGPDVVRSQLPNNLYHDACDLVILPGDMQDSGDSDNNPPSAEDQRQWANVRGNILDILEEHNIPWMATIGNHDSDIKYVEVVDALLTASPYFYARSTAYGLSHALLIPMPSGQQLCVIGVSNSASHGAGPINTDGNDFFTANVGCGAEHPTIAMSHSLGGMLGSGSCGVGATDTLANFVNAATSDETWLAVAGHHTVSPTTTTCKAWTAPANYSGENRLYINNNIQELYRHRQDAFNLPYGASIADNCGGLYTLVTLDPVNSKIYASDWNPYWQTNESKPINPGCGYLTTTISEDFDFNGRFPP